jgi:hypothetical protein
MTNEAIRLNCPKCGLQMEWVRLSGTGHRIHVLKCPEHGTYHVGDLIPLTPGEPE